MKLIQKKNCVVKWKLWRKKSVFLSPSFLLVKYIYHDSYSKKSTSFILLTPILVKMLIWFPKLTLSWQTLLTSSGLRYCMLVMQSCRPPEGWKLTHHVSNWLFFYTCLLPICLFPSPSLFFRLSCVVIQTVCMPSVSDLIWSLHLCSCLLHLWRHLTCLQV